MTETTRTMEPGLSRRSREVAGGRSRLAVAVPPRAQPLIAPAPRSAMFFPLVVLVAVLPGMVALNSWDLTPPGPLWGLRALAVLDGLAIDQVPAAITIKPSGESAALRALSFQPPLYAWLAALGMRLTADLDPLASVLPSYVAGVLVVVLVYLHGRVWRGGGMGLAAVLLVGFNPNLLLRMQEATPTTLAVAGAMGALLCYGWHQRRGGIGTALALGWSGLLGGRRRPFSWPLAAGPGRIRADRDPGCDLASGLSAGRIDFTAGFPLTRQVPLAGLVANRGGDRWSAGPGDRLDRGTSLAHPDGPDAWLGSLDRARVPVLGNGRQRGFSTGSAVRAGAGYPTTGNLRCRAGHSPGPDR